MPTLSSCFIVRMPTNASLPDLVKQIFLDTATDLKRTRTFQGRVRGEAVEFRGPPGQVAVGSPGGELPGDDDPGIRPVRAWSPFRSVRTT